MRNVKCLIKNQACSCTFNSVKLDNFDFSECVLISIVLSVTGIVAIFLTSFISYCNLIQVLLYFLYKTNKIANKNIKISSVKTNNIK